MSHLSSATAHALKAAGLSQPKPAGGQVWYNTAGTPYYITAADGERCDYVAGQTLFVDRYLNDGEVFAPDAEYILAKLSKRVYPDIVIVDASAYDSEKPEIAKDPNYWVRSVPNNKFFNTGDFPNLAETLATAYLALSQTPAP